MGYLCKTFLSCLSALAVAISAGSCKASYDMLQDYIVFRNHVQTLIGDGKFAEADTALKKAKVAANAAALAPAIIYLEKHCMPKHSVSAAEEQMLKDARLSFGDFEEYLRKGKECVLKYPNSEFAHMLLSSAYLWQENDTLAIAEAQKALQLSPQNVGAMEKLGSCYIQAGQKESAIKTHRAIQLIDPKNSEAVNFFCMLEQASGDITQLRYLDRHALIKQMAEELAEKRRQSSKQP